MVVRRLGGRMLVVGAIALGCAVIPSSASAVTIQPDVLTDGIANDGNCTLREAVQAANTNATVDQCLAGDSAARDIIRLDSGHYTLTAPGAFEDLNQTGDLDLTGGGALRIEGEGVIDTYIDANMGEHVLADDGEVNLELADMSLTSNARSQYGGIADIRDVDFVAERVDMSGGSAQFGGALFLNNASSTLSRVSVHDSEASVSGTGFPTVTALGGAIDVSGGTATITDSTFENNEAFADDSQALGGGIAIDDGADVTIRNSTVSGNETRSSSNSGVATRNGGGIYAETATVEIVNSTVADNIANNSGANSGGGGIYGSDALVTVSSSTFSNNTATFGSAAAADGGGISFGASIVDAPSALFICAEANSGEVGSNGYNVIFPSQTGCLDQTTDIQDDPQLSGSPVELGGYTKTLELGPGSAAYNAVPKSSCVDAGSGDKNREDQRGVERPFAKRCEAGAYEYSICAKEVVDERFIFGTPGDDLLKGNGAANKFAPSAGNDTIKAAGNKDFACGGSGNDKISGGGTNDKLFGGAGKDTLDGGPGDDKCVGESGKDKTKRCERGPSN